MLHRTNLLLAFCVVLFGTLAARADEKAATTQPAGVTGTWHWTMPGPGGDIDFTLKLKQDGDKVTGTLSGFNGNDSDIQDGKIEDGKITFKVVRDFNGNQVSTNYTATLEGSELKGSSETVFKREFDAKRD